MNDSSQVFLPKMLNLNNIQPSDAEMNVQFANEKSRTVKMCMLKYRCVLMFTFMLLSFMQFGYIVFKEFLDDSALKTKMVELVELYFTGNKTNKNYFIYFVL